MLGKKKAVEKAMPASAGGPTVRTDTTGKNWKVKSDGSGLEPADGGPAVASTGR